MCLELHPLRKFTLRVVSPASALAFLMIFTSWATVSLESKVKEASRILSVLFYRLFLTSSSDSFFYLELYLAYLSTSGYFCLGNEDNINPLSSKAAQEHSLVAI